ncbi:MAG: cohesin domain-containing protein [Acidobacteria bacterium]|nr:cohesin domain-containing protein [Acidobacteriota bacterium]
MRNGDPGRHALRRHGAVMVLLCLALAACISGSPYKLARKYDAVGDYDRAILQYSKALNQEPENARYQMDLRRARFRASQLHFDKAKKYLQAGRLELAIQELQVAVMMDTGNDYALIELQKAQAALRDRREAEAQIDDLEELKRKSRASLEAPKLNPASNVPIVLKFNDEALGKLFDALAKASGINFLYDDRVELNKRISVDQAGIDFEQALNLLMLQNKLFYKVIDQNTLIIIPDNRQKRQEYEDQVIKTFYLSNAEVKDVQTVLRTLLDARKVAVNDQLNSITIKDTPDVVAVAEKLVANADKAKAEVIVDVEILEINSNTFRNLGIDITTSALSLAFQGGTDGNLSLGNLNAINNKAAWLLGPVPAILMNFLKTDSDTQVIAKPQLRVTEGERAQLNIGQRVPIPTTSFNTGNTIGGNIVPLTSFTYQNVGISVEIEPRVHHNREVTLNVAVEVSALAGQIAGTGGQSQPIIGTRNINTVIRLKEGETQILAGLIQENERESLRTIPGLDKIPILRKIFGTHETTKERTDIILTLTPYIIRLPDIREEDLQAMWVGTSSNLVLKGADRSPFAGESPFAGKDLEGGDGGAGLSGSPSLGLEGQDTESALDEDRGGGSVEESRDDTGDDDDDDQQPQVVVLNMVPSIASLTVGQVFSVDVQIFQARNVVSTPFKLRFDPTHLEYVSGSQGPFLAAGGNVSFLAGLDTQNPGTLSVGLAILGVGPGGGVDNNGTLCRLSFRVLPQAKAAGSTSIIPFANKVFAPGMNERPSIFRSLTLNVDG